MQLKLHMVTIEDLVPQEHFLRKLEAALDLSFVEEETAYLYCLMPVYAREGLTLTRPPHRSLYKLGNKKCGVSSADLFRSFNDTPMVRV